MMTNSAEVAAQFTARASWEDGSVQTLDVDFNASLDPEEDRRYELQFGPSVTCRRADYARTDRRRRSPTRSSSAT